MLKGEQWKKIHDTNTNQKKVGLAILISDKVDFGAKNTFRNKENYLTMING